MQLDTGYKVTRFGLSENSEVTAGDLFIAKLATGQVVHAIRAFRVEEPGDEPDFCFVAVGPFGGETPAGPHVFEPSVLREGPVLRLTGPVYFRPSLDIADLQPLEECAEIDLVSKVVITENATFLGVVKSRGPSWVVAYLEVATGHLTFPKPTGRAMVSSRWSLVMKRGGEAPATLFEWPEDGGGREAALTK